MSLEISRRDWLKGIMASAGLAAVGVPLDIVEAAAPAIVKSPAKPLAVEVGDFWISHNGTASFIGRMTSLDMRHGYVEYFDGGEFMKCIPDGSTDAEISLFPDEEGYRRVYDALEGRKMIEAIFGHHSGAFVMQDSFLTQVQAVIGPHDLMIQCSVFGRKGGLV